MDKAIEIEEYALIDSLDELNIKIKEGWILVNTFPNPYPQPYFFSLIGKIKQGESISVLQAHKAKTESLKEWVKAQKGVAKKTFDEEEYSQLNDRTYTIFENILQKLEELDK